MLPPIEPRFLPMVTPSPTEVPGGVSFSAISAGGGHTCGLDHGTGRAWCWGPGQHGELGNGANESSVVPVAILGDHNFTVVSAGLSFSCGVDTSAAAWCW